MATVAMVSKGKRYFVEKKQPPKNKKLLASLDTKINRLFGIKCHTGHLSDFQEDNAILYFIFFLSLVKIVLFYFV